jgi:Family of unknown function (DUF6600)/FecR protein
MNKPGSNNLKLWPHLTIIAILFAVIAGVGVALWMKHEQSVAAEALPDAARLQRVDGEVALNNSLDTNAANDQVNAQWETATANQPVSVGDRIYTRDNSRASLAFTGRNFARLNPNTSLDILSLNERRTQLALRDGSAMFDVGYLTPGELFEVATPYGAVDFDQPGLYNVGIDNGNVLVSVLSGLAQVVGLGDSGRISKGQMLTLVGQTAADVVLSRMNGSDAGYLVNDYYSYQYPQYYDGRYRNYDAYLNDPYYFDPYRRNVSYQYVNSYIPGLSDLDYYGSWQNVAGYGYAWAPRVDSDWAPYQQGYWINDYPYGPTWVSAEPWGYAPYHYGRWCNVSNQWYWVPDNVNSTPYYSPALVAFVPFNQNEIGWVPLGPGDPYAPRYYYSNNWQPYYLSRTQIVQPRVANLYVPGAVTVVPIDDFTRGVDLRRVRRADRQMLAQVHPVLDPLTLTPLRNAVIHSAWGRGKKELPPGIAKKLYDTPVLTGSTPIAPPFRRDLVRDMHVKSAADDFKGRKFNVRDERQGKGVEQAVQAPNQTRIPDRGQPNNDGRRGQRNVEQQQRQQADAQQRMERAMQNAQAQRAARAAQQQAQGERVGRKAQPQPRPTIAPSRSPQNNSGRASMREMRPARQPAARPARQAPPARSVERHGPPVQVQQRQAPAARSVERHGPPVQVQQRQAQPKQAQERGGGKPERPASNPSQKRGGKGKGEKP